MYFTIHRYKNGFNPVYAVTANTYKETVTLNTFSLENPGIRYVGFDENCEIRKFYYWNVEEV